jgi:hypothetical protein
MKITDFNKRVQGFYAKYVEENDGDFTLTLEESKWLWVKITPLSFQQNMSKDEATTYQNRYEMTMQKTHNSNTRHACLRQLRWNHKLLTIYTPWLETSDMTCIKGLAKESVQEEHDG